MVKKVFTAVSQEIMMIYDTYRFIYSNETDVNAIAQQLVTGTNQTAT